MQARYTSNLWTFQVVEIFFSRSGGSRNCKKTSCGLFFFQIFMLNISSIKELLHKPPEIQWNIKFSEINGNLMGFSTRKTKKKSLLGFILQDITPWNKSKHEKLLFFGYFRGLKTNVKFNGFLWFCEFLNFSAFIFWLETVLTLS